ncbi:MAG TPA: NAD(P)-dependent oxidoreductase [Paenirhodobacter sp.]
MSQRTLVIANQLSADFGAFLARHPSAPHVITGVDADRPWLIPDEADIVITRAFAGWKSAPATCPALPNLKWVQTYSAGVEIYPDWLKAGRIVSCGRGLTAPQIAEYALAAMLRFEKRLDTYRATCPDDWITRPMGSLEGKTLGLIGFGAIGQETVRRAQAFGMQIHACRRGAWTQVPDGVTAADSPEQVISVADHLVLAMPLTDETRCMVDAALLAQAKPGLHLINVARGGLVVQADLIAALNAGRLAFATLDVTTPEPLPAGDPLWTHPQVLLTPHVSYVGGPEEARFRSKVLANLDAFCAGQPLNDVVDLTRGY